MKLKFDQSFTSSNHFEGYQETELHSVEFCKLKRWHPYLPEYPEDHCLHLQLYRDSKDRYKQGQTKASLSLQHFLGIHSGFTLDKESNTIAIICQDVTVVLAFDTRERLIQWQVKIANNLGEDEQFLVQIQTAPSRGKMIPGPARLHVQEHQFCMTVGVPPRLVGYWQIGQLRRYGVVENRFCFEGGSRCGRGEGLYVLVTDQAQDLSRAFQLAAEGKLYSRRRQLSRSVLDSPRRRVEAIQCEGETDEVLALPWPSCETRADCDYADTASVNELPNSSLQEGGVWTTENSMERCMSCISKLGALSRSSTMAQTPGSGFTPAWTMETNNSRGGHQSSVNPENYISLPSGPSNLPQHHSCTSEKWSHTCVETSTTTAELCQCYPPSRPPKPSLPLESVSQTGPYCNYDVPKPIPPAQHLMAQNHEAVCSPTDELYDTPKQLKENLKSGGEFENYDTPQVVTNCSCPQHGGSVIRRGFACPCHRVLSWMSLPYCRRGYGRENTTAPCIQRVKLSGQGKMPIASTNNTMPIYATVDRSKKTKCRLMQIPNENQESTFLENNLLQDNNKLGSIEEMNSSNNTSTVNSSEYKDHSSTTERFGVVDNSRTYMNLEFAQSLEFYENSKDILNRAHITNINNDKELCPANDLVTQRKLLQKEVKYCKKCGHACNQNSSTPDRKQDDYLMMGPSNKENKPEDSNTQSHYGYLPMQPVSGDGGSKGRLLECNFTNKKGLLSMRAASSPSLSIPVIYNSKQSTINIRESGSSVNQSVSASNSPYFQRKLLNNLGVNEDEGSRSNSLLRRRSNSADSARYLDDLESITERTVSSSSTQVNDSKHTSIDSLCSQSFGVKRLNDVSLSNDSSFSNLPPCIGDTLVVEKDIQIVPYDEPEKKYEMSNQIRCSVRDTVDLPGLAVHIRRSSSVPCKSGHNRDSSSSNDSGVSIGSLKQRGSDFVEFELPLTTSMSTRRHHHALNQRMNMEHANCFHASLPRRSKSSDLLRELSFKFQDMKIATKSSSAEAEIPICLIKKDTKDYLSTAGPMPYIDSRSTSSGTSDMSDYIETLSLSSYSSSDTPESLRFSRTAATTLRPRSGKEYHKIDRYFWDGDVKKPPYTAIPPVVESLESSNLFNSQDNH